MAKAIDYSFARPAIGAIKDRGFVAVIRYLAPLNPSTRGKIVDLQEARALRRAGLDLVLNWEWYESRATEGAPAGRDDGRTARLMAHALGYPAGAAIYFSCDMDTHDTRRTNAYFASARGALGPYRMGAYGGYDVITAAHRAQVIDLSWQTTAWSQGRWNPASVLRQTGAQVFGRGADINLIEGIYYGADARRWVASAAHQHDHRVRPSAALGKPRAAGPAAVVPPAVLAPAVVAPAVVAPARKPAAKPINGHPITKPPVVKPPVVKPPVVKPPVVKPPIVGGPAAPPPQPPPQVLSGADVATVIDARMSFWLPRLAALLRRGEPNAAFTSANAGSLLDGVGLDGVHRAATPVFFAAVDAAGGRLDDMVWMSLGTVRTPLPNAAVWLALDPAATLREVVPEHPLFELPAWPTLQRSESTTRTASTRGPNSPTAPPFENGAAQ